MTLDTTLLMQYISYLAIIVGMMAGIVSVITQVIKEFPGLDSLPTKAVVIITSLLFCPVAFIMYASWQSIQIEGYMIFACVIGSFFVAMVAMGGWDTVYKIWDRVKPNQKIE